MADQSRYHFHIFKRLEIESLAKNTQKKGYHIKVNVYLCSMEIMSNIKMFPNKPCSLPLAHFSLDVFGRVGVAFFFLWQTIRCTETFNVHHFFDVLRSLYAPCLVIIKVFCPRILYEDIYYYSKFQIYRFQCLT